MSSILNAVHGMKNPLIPANDNRPPAKILPFPKRPLPRPTPRKLGTFGKRLARVRNPASALEALIPLVIEPLMPVEPSRLPHPRDIPGIDWEYCIPGLEHDQGVENQCGTGLRYPGLTGVDYGSAQCGYWDGNNPSPWTPTTTAASMFGSWSYFFDPCPVENVNSQPTYYRINGRNGQPLPEISPTPTWIPWEIPVPTPAPRRRARPEPRPDPKPDPDPLRLPPPVELTPGYPPRPLPRHRPDPKPRRRGPEVKRRIVNENALEAFKIIQDIFHKITEVQDVVDAIFEALPKDLQKGVKTPQGKVMAILNNLDAVDWMEALYNIAYNHVEDAVAGKFFGELEKAAKKLGVTGAYKFELPTLGRK